MKLSDFDQVQRLAGEYRELEEQIAGVADGHLSVRLGYRLGYDRPRAVGGHSCEAVFEGGDVGRLVKPAVTSLMLERRAAIVGQLVTLGVEVNA